MDPDLQQTHAKLRALRERKDLALKATPLLRRTVVGPDGRERPLHLRYYQVQMIFHLLAMRNFIVGDDTGLGKTVETIAALCYLWQMYPDKKAVILGNKAAVLQWKQEFRRFTTGVQIIVARGTPAQRESAYERFEAAQGPTVLISGYRSMVKDIARVQDWEGHVLVTDEATVYKNPSTQVHQLVRHLSQRSDRTWGLTATIIKNNLMEAFGILQVVVPGLFRHTRTAFMNDYCITRLQRIRGNRQIPVITGYRQRDIDRFREKIDPYYLGRPKHEVADELPILTTRNVEVGMTNFQKQLYQDALDGLLQKADGELKETDKLTAIIYCQEIIDHPCLLGYDESDSQKMDALVDMLSEDGEFGDEHVIIYTKFRRLVDFAIPYLKKKGIDCLRVTGKENEDERQDAMDEFQGGKGRRVIWITDAGGDSINLQAAKAIIFYDTPWSAGDYLQILGRMIRIGSIHDRCYALHLEAKGTVDTRVRQVKDKKMKLIEAVLGARIRGEKEDDVVYDTGSGAREVFDYLVEDARGKVAS